MCSIPLVSPDFSIKFGETMNQIALLAEFGTPINRVREALIALQNGQGILLLDDENRENEGDSIFIRRGRT